MQHIKCVVVGDGTVGKTCLLITYTMKAFPKDYVPTVFDNYNAVVMWDGQPINLGLWDTAGQDDFQMMRPMSYQNADIFLVFFAIDNPVSFQNVKYKWIPEITKGDSREVPRLLVGTKNDCRDDEKRLGELKAKNIKPITYKQGKKLANETSCVSYIECSAITNKGFRDVFGQTIMAIINFRNGKRPGSACWSTKCFKDFSLLSKKNKCVRCNHQYCPDCVVLLPKNHEWGNKLICKKCRDIEDDEPMKRNFTKKNSKGRLNEVSELNNGGDKEVDPSKRTEAVPVTKEALLGGILQSVSQYAPLPEGAEEEEEQQGSRRGGKGKEKKESNKNNSGAGSRKRSGSSKMASSGSGTTVAPAPAAAPAIASSSSSSSSSSVAPSSSPSAAEVQPLKGSGLVKRDNGAA
jgi:Ras-related C3 botulinum toxin substrate 1